MLLANTMPLMSRLADSHLDWSYDQHLCPFCNLHKPETVEHFVAECSFYKDLRQFFLDQLRQIPGARAKLENFRRWLVPNNEVEFSLRLVLDDRTVHMMPEDGQRDRMRSIVLNYLKRIYSRRNAVWSDMTEHDKPWRLLT